MENKRKNIYIVIFIITTIISASSAVYFGVKGTKDIEKLEAKLNENTKLTDDVTNVQEEKNNEQTEKNNTEVVEKVVEKFGVFDFNISNSLNSKNDNAGYSKRLYLSLEYYGFNCNVESDKKTMSLRLDAKKFNEFFPNIINDSDFRSAEYTFDKKIIDIVIGSFGQALGNEVVLCIMDDGSVEYMHLMNAVKNNNLKSFKKLEGVSDIVSIQTANTGAKGGGGWITTLAFNNKGEFYDLYKTLRDAGVIN